MAWFIDTSLLNEDRPSARPTPETLAAYDKVRLALTAKYETLARDDPLRGVGEDSVQMINGYGLPDFEPRVVTVRRWTAALPDVVSTGIGYLVSHKVRDEIERIEPDRHQFLRTLVEFDTGERHVDRWSYLVIRGRL